MQLIGYIARRVLQLIPTLIFILIVVFALVRLLPGDPASAILGDRALEADVERINRELGLDRPLPVQFWVFVKSVAHGRPRHLDPPQAAGGRSHRRSVCRSPSC